MHVKRGDHMKGARLLVRVANNISKFPSRKCWQHRRARCALHDNSLIIALEGTFSSSDSIKHTVKCKCTVCFATLQRL